MTSLRGLQKEIAAWADSLIPERTAQNAIAKLMLEEIPELLLNPSDELEYADVVILVLDIAHLQGINIEQAVMKKMAINRGREWAVDPATGLMKHKHKVIINEHS